MSSIREAVRPFAEHPAVASVSAVWTDLPRVLLLGGGMVLAAVPGWVAFMSGFPVGAVVAGWLFLGPASVYVLRAVSGSPTRGIRLPGPRAVVAGRVLHDGLALAAPAAVAVGCTLGAAAMHPASGTVSVIRVAALTIDLLAIGTTAVVLPAAAGLVGGGAHVDRRLWRAAAGMAGSRPRQVIETLALAALLVVAAGLGGRIALLPVVLIGPALLATIVCALWRPE